MSHSAAKIVPVLGFLAVAAAGMSGLDDAGSVARAARGPEEVLVANPASNPVQTSIVGPVTATIGNTEAIPVAVQGTPSVAVSGAVTVANTEAQPVPVRDVTAARTAWVGGGQLIIDPGETFEAEQFFAPPPGQRLVIEAVSFEAFVPTGQIAYRGTVLASAAGEGAIFRFPLAPLSGAGTATFDAFAAAEHTALNVSGGVVVSVSRNSSTGTGLVNVALSGYLVADN